MGDVLDGGTRARSRRVLTVGIPVFNGKSLLRNCLESVINSTLAKDEYEILVVDDASTDPQTGAILRDFERRLAKNPGFFRVLTSARNSGGAARPRNQIIDAAAGDYLFFVDSDDTIGNLALQRIVDAISTTSPDWVAINQVPVNGRGGVCRVSEPQAVVTRAKALTTLTVHKVFRRAEIQRQQLRFDEKLPSGQDWAFAFSYIVNAERFVMLGGYDYYYLTQHANNPNEPAHLSRRADTPEAVIEKNERILRSMLDTLQECSLDRIERAKTLATVVLPRALIQSGYLTAVAGAGPDAGPRALRRLSKLLSDPLLADVEPTDLLEVTPAQLAAVAASDWAALVTLMRPDALTRPVGVRARWVGRGQRVVNLVSGRARHRQVAGDLARLQRSMESLRDEQRRLEALLRAEFSLRDLIAAQQRPTGTNAVPGEPRALASAVIQEVVRHVLTHQPGTVVQCGTGAATMSLGRALDLAGEGRLISLETSSEWAGTFNGLLEHEGMRSVEIRHAPIEPVEVGARTATWYATTALADVDTIDLLLVDGVRGRSERPTRYPALPVLRDRLRHGATVMLDDCQWDEKETLSRWLKDVPGLTLVRQVKSLAVMEIA